MKDIRVKDLIKFRSLSEKSQGTFITNLQKEKIAKEKDESSGGDYWVRSISALKNSFRENENKYISEKIADIINDYSPKLDEGTKIKYDRNLQILYNFEDFDFRSVTPSEDIEVLSKVRKSGVIDINGLDLKVETHHIYSYTRGDQQYVGALLFASKKDGYKSNELGIFAESIFRFLEKNYADKYHIDPSSIKVIDVITQEIVDCQMVLDKAVPSLLGNTIDEIKKINIKI